MTVSATTTRNDYIASSGQTVFAYTFKVLASTDLVVTKNGVVQSAYSVSDIGVATGGTVTFNSGVTANDAIALYLAMPVTRDTNYQEGGAFLAGEVNSDFDKIYIGAIQNENAIDRSMRLPESEPSISMTLPSKDARKGRYLQFNATTGAPEAGQSIIGDYSAGTGLDLTNYVFSIDNTVATLTGTQTLSDKTLTSPILNQDLSGSAFLDEDNMASNSSTKVASQQSIKAYVDSQVGAADTLSEVLANGNTTGGNDVKFGTDDKATFGASDNLEIYSDGTNAFLKELGTGSLSIQATDIFLQSAESEVYLYCIANSGVTLFHNGASKFQTTSTGIDVTGSITADGLNIGTTSDAYSAAFIISSATGESELRMGDTDTDAGSIAYTNSDDTMTFRAAAGARMTLDSTGIDVTGDVVASRLKTEGTEPTLFFNDTTTGHDDWKMYADWDQFQIQQYVNDTTWTSRLHFAANGNATFSGTATMDGLTVSNGTNTTAIPATSDRVSFTAGNSFIQSTGALFVQPAGDLVLNGTGAEIMRLKSGKVGIGTSFPQYITEIAKSQSGGVGPTLYLHNTVDDPVAGHAAEIRFNLRAAEATTRNAAIQAVAEGTYGTSPALTFLTSSGSSGSATERMRITSDGNVGIGTTSPDDDLHIANNTQAGPALRLENQSVSTDSNTIYASINFEGNDNSAGANGIRGSIVGKSLSTNGAMGLLFSTASAGGANTERMRIDSSGNLLVGKSAASLSTAGVTAYGGSYNGLLASVRDGGEPLYLNRLTSDGSIASFQKDGTTVGSIGATSSELGIGGGDANLLFMPNDNAIAPSSTSSGGASDGALDLGRSARRFRDLYLSGGTIVAGRTTFGSAGFWDASGTGNNKGLRVGGAGLYPTNGSGTALNATLDIGTAAARFKDLHLSGKASVDTLQFAQNSGAAGATEAIYRATTGTIAFKSSSSERMRIDSGGSLLIGQTVGNVYNQTSVTGLKLDGPNGNLQIARSNNPTLLLNRYGNDGDLALFFKDGAGVGSIGVLNGNNLSISGSVSNHTGIQFGTAVITPMKSGAENDGDVDLGFSNARFKDLYLSGGVYLGGTGVANKLDDYEEGTWTPSITNSTGSYVTRVGRYTKIGNLVYVVCNVNTAFTNIGSTFQNIEGLPFTSENVASLFSVGTVFPVQGFNQGNSDIAAQASINTTNVALYTVAPATGVNYTRIASSTFGTTVEFEFSLCYTVA